jgi:uncharacterized protein YlxP (DUF503 family)
MSIKIGILTIHLHFPGCSSLKEKRGILKSLIAKTQNKFKISIAEIGHLDVWQDSQIACAVVSNDGNQAMAILQNVLNWISDNWHEGYIADDSIEIIY